MDNFTLSAMSSGLVLQKLGKLLFVAVMLSMVFFVIQPAAAKSQAYKIFRELSRYKMIWLTRDWDEIQGSKFIVRYTPQDSSIAAMVFESAEKSYEPVIRNFSGQYKGKILVVIYPNKESLGRSFGWASDESAMGVYWAGVIRVLSPSIWIKENDPEMLKEVFYNEGPLAHELTHLLVDYETGGNYTRWFTEGIAQYIEVKVTGYRIDYRSIDDYDELYSLSQMDRNFDSLYDQNLAYIQSLMAINCLVEYYGEKSLWDILRKLGQGQSMEFAFKNVLGVSMEQFERDFNQWVIK
ncbi:peptidase MA family metallohydrolase [Phosphitispora sp. TUW77]|uniref:peptidase MA family metallohydrolase n=1 Tax=Phosphitispora sp. TUW77 TaxID=3152361 RepID=UPI003AB17E25